MSELLFPIAALVVTFFVLIPLCTFLSCAVLKSLRDRARVWTDFASEATFAWIVAPVLLPALWLFSSTLREGLGARSAGGCLVDHAGVAACIDGLLLLASLLGLMGLTLVFRLWRELPRGELNALANDHPLVESVSALCATDPYLSTLRVRVVECSPEPLYTRGLFRAQVVLDACFVREADREMMRAALLHEHAHILGFDTLRSFVARLCLRVNPAGKLLEPDFQRWLVAREASCDGSAVHRGGDALALAQSIIHAARFQCGALPRAHASLRGNGRQAMKLRLALLMDGPSTPEESRGDRVLALALVVAALAPQVFDVVALERFHFAVERLLHTVL